MCKLVLSAASPTARTVGAVCGRCDWRAKRKFVFDLCQGQGWRRNSSGAPKAPSKLPRAAAEHDSAARGACKKRTRQSHRAWKSHGVSFPRWYRDIGCPQRNARRELDASCTGKSIASASTTHLHEKSLTLNCQRFGAACVELCTRVEPRCQRAGVDQLRQARWRR